MSHSIRLPELDGVRAIAVALVIAGHAATEQKSSVATISGILVAVFGNAALGVQLFFVLSGFLITSLLLREERRTGAFQLGAFYLRRARRILPAFFAYIVAIAFMDAVGWLNVDTAHFLSAISQTWNYQVLWIGEPKSVAGIWYFGHYWSLSLEEQYYLFWPIALIAVPRRQLPALLLCMAFVMPIIRIVWYFLFPEQRGSLGMFFHTASDSLMWGSWLAFLMGNPPEWLLRATGNRVFRVVMLLVVLVAQPLAAESWGGKWSLPFGISLNAFGATYFLALLRCHADWRPLLSTAPLVFLGGMSYSLYIWQQLFLAPSWAGGPQFPLWAALPLLFCAAWASWRFVERPFLAVRGSGVRIQT